MKDFTSDELENFPAISAKYAMNKQLVRDDDALYLALCRFRRSKNSKKWSDQKMKKRASETQDLLHKYEETTKKCWLQRESTRLSWKS